ncbi:MAG: hypothetical protein KGM42_07305 [Hyphomicrobiales bacterium]|nr:hypothetical protein [Hyphomicrobiales bacterium]
MRRAAFALIALALFWIAPANAQIVALGGSNVRGYGVSRSEAFPARLEAMLRARGKTWSVVNEGVSGQTTAGVLGRLGSTVPQGARIVVLVAGGNDLRFGGTLESVRANKRLIVERLAARGVRVIDATPQMYAALRRGMAQADRIHLTPEGHRWLAAQIASQIR